MRFNRVEQERLEGLLPALEAGLDPTQAYSIFSGVQDSALNRMAQNQAMRQSMFAQAGDQVRELAMSGVPQSGAMDLIDSYQEQVPGLGRGKYQGRLEDLVRQGAYQGPGQISDLYQPDPASVEGTPAAGLTPEDIGHLSTEAMAAAAVDPETGAPVDSLHGVRMRWMTILREQGYAEDALNQAYDILGRAYTAAGGSAGDTPLTTAQRMAQMVSDPASSLVSGIQSPFQSSGGGSSPLYSLGQRQAAPSMGDPGSYSGMGVGGGSMYDPRRRR